MKPAVSPTSTLRGGVVVIAVIATIVGCVDIDGRAPDGPCDGPETVCVGQQVQDRCGTVIETCGPDEVCVVHPEDATLALCDGTCAQDADCDAGLVCRRYGDFSDCVLPAGNGEACAGDDGDAFLTHTCAEGLVCERTPSWPDGGHDFDICVGATDRVDYALCDDDAQCASGVCFTNVEDDGVCTPDECRSDGDCADGTVCLSFGGATRCIAPGGVGAPCAGATADGYEVVRTCAADLTCTDEDSIDDDVVRCE